MTTKGGNALLSSYMHKDPAGINYFLLLLASIIMINDTLKNISRTFGVPR